MTKIDTTQPDYNENVLTDDFTFDNSLTWNFTVGGGIPGVIGANSTDEHYVGSKSLKIYNPQYNLNDITIEPTTSGDYEFTVPRSGEYIFSIRTYIKANVWLPEVSGGISFYANGGGSPFKTFSLSIGNNSEPEFSYSYNKWQAFHENVSLLEGDIITLSIHINKESLFTPGVLQMYFDGFKLEYNQDRAYSIPTLYTKPIN